MLKISCPDCGQTFLWTDDMPLEGPCPNPECQGRYDVHRSVRLSVAERSPKVARKNRCPACGAAIASSWTLCSHCGQIVAGSRSFRRRDLLLAVALILLLGSLLSRYLWP